MLEIKTVTNGTPVRGKALLTAAIEKISRESIVAPCGAKWSDIERNSLNAVYSRQGNDQVIQTV
jgi:hypothetical protein